MTSSTPPIRSQRRWRSKVWSATTVSWPILVMGKVRTSARHDATFHGHFSKSDVRQGDEAPELSLQAVLIILGKCVGQIGRKGQGNRLHLGPQILHIPFMFDGKPERARQQDKGRA
ncbi:MAG: hypothetical protein A2516_02695 [Alphaproteobacteria bacterium RIFOXYD12_FULL_60_8]|nr:MAG: hypothetical protein A2516_02695 [Alphaproteobacteria bacterium RIFOXYD12_FULL_60_8]